MHMLKNVTVLTENVPYFNLWLWWRRLACNKRMCLGRRRDGFVWCSCMVMWWQLLCIGSISLQGSNKTPHSPTQVIAVMWPGIVHGNFQGTVYCSLACQTLVGGKECLIRTDRFSWTSPKRWCHQWDWRTFNNNYLP